MSLVPLVRFCLERKPDAWVCLYIPRGMKELLEKEVGPCRMELTIKTRKGGRLRDGAGAESVVFCWNAKFGVVARQLAAKLESLALAGDENVSAIAADRKPSCCSNCGQ